MKFSLTVKVGIDHVAAFTHVELLALTGLGAPTIILIIVLKVMKEMAGR